MLKGETHNDKAKQQNSIPEDIDEWIVLWCQELFFHSLHICKNACLCFRYATFSTHFYFHLLSPWCVLKSCQPNKQISAFPISLIKDSLMMYAVLSRMLLIWLPGSSVQGILQARKLEWISIPFSRGSSRPRDWTWVSCIAAGFFIIWATREVPYKT